MTRIRLREAHEDLSAIYPEPFNSSDTTKDHSLRIGATIAIAKWFDDVSSVADLSCGDGVITQALKISHTILGDFAPGYELCGPIEETIEQIPSVDLFVCSETLEHLDDPDSVLRSIRAKTRYLVCSTPIDEWNPIHNPEHYWGWGVDDVGQMLRDAGFEKVVFGIVETPPEYLYHFQIWGCQ